MKYLLLCVIAVMSMSVFSASNNELTIRSLKTLVVIYRGAPSDAVKLSDKDVEGIKKGVEYARLFYWRSSRCRLNAEITYLVVPMTSPNSDGPTYEFLEADLRKRGIKDNQYDGILSTGVGFHGNWGGFRIFGKTGAAFGIPGKGSLFNWVPENDPETWYDMGWIFTHEFQHALDLVISEVSGHPEMLHDHPYSDSAAPYFWWGHPAAQHWDWVGYTLEQFKGYDTLTAATNTVIKAIDRDNDGFPDNDKRLPMDEKRFGSNPALADTDGDGLSDLAEFTADRYRGSDPNNTDTDNDGIIDGEENYPTVAIKPTARYAAAEPVIDGAFDKFNEQSVYQPLIANTYISSSPDLAASQLYFCWTEDAIYCFVKTKVKCSLELQIDTSADNGFWEGGDTYGFNVSPDGAVRSLWPNKVLSEAVSAWGEDGLEVKIPAELGVGLWIEEANRGPHIGKSKPIGMKLLKDNVISVNAIIDANPHKALFTPNWTMFNTRLVKQSDDPCNPSLKYSQNISSEAQPKLIVTGVREQDRVEIVNDKGVVVAERIGDGEVFVPGKLTAGYSAANGANTLFAKVGDIISKPFNLIVDRVSLTPTVNAENGKLSIFGEQNANVEVYIGTAVSPYSGFTSVKLDDKGSATIDLPRSLQGFIGGYGVDKQFDKPNYYRFDSVIDFEYQDQKPDPRSPSDNFSMRWTGFLDVQKEDLYTFHLTSDDGSRLYIDGDLIIDNWGQHGAETKSAQVKLTAGNHVVRVDYYEQDGWAMARLEWEGVGMPRTTKLPVTPAPKSVGSLYLWLRQVDAVGNISTFSQPLEWK